MQTKCVVDTETIENGRVADGIPVIGTDAIGDAISKHSINYVLIADTFLSNEKRQEIRNVNEEKQIDVVDRSNAINLNSTL